MTTTLKITTATTPHELAIRLEGRLAGPAVDELRRAWDLLTQSSDSKKVSIDLCSLTFVDAAGRKLLRQIHQATNAEFQADGPLTKLFAAEACGEASAE
jgi:anti-anti-sigma regulatory factor